MPTAPDKIPENIDFAVEELLEAPADQRPAMLEAIAKALTRRLLQDSPGIGIREVSERVTAFQPDTAAAPQRRHDKGAPHGMHHAVFAQSQRTLQG